MLTFIVRDNFFFWDTVQLGSIHAQFYFDNNFSFFFLPENIDSGHPPTFGIYIALIWKIFGKSLVTSHFAMLPFLMGIIFTRKLVLNGTENTFIIPLITLLAGMVVSYFQYYVLISPEMLALAKSNAAQTSLSLLFNSIKQCSIELYASASVETS